MRILFSSDSTYPNKDGVARTIDLLKKFLEKHGHEVYIMSPIDGDIKLKGIPLPFYKDYKIAIPKKINGEFDIIHNHSLSTPALIARQIAKKNGIPILNTYHTDIITASQSYIPIPGINKLAKIYLKYILGNILTTVPSKKSLDQLKELGIKSIKIPIPINIREFKYSEQKEDYLIHVGRIVKEKKIDMFFPFVKEMKIKLLVVGKGPAIEYYKSKANEYVEFLGFVSDEELKTLISKASALVFGSDFDTFGLVCLEALASGTPAIVHSKTAFYEIFPEFGFSNFEEFKKAYQKAISYDKKILRKKAEEFDIEKIGREYLSIYNRLLEEF